MGSLVSHLSLSIFESASQFYIYLLTVFWRLIVKASRTFVWEHNDGWRGWWRITAGGSVPVHYDVSVIPAAGCLVPRVVD